MRRVLRLGRKLFSRSAGISGNEGSGRGEELGGCCAVDNDHL